MLAFTIEFRTTPDLREGFFFFGEFLALERYVSALWYGFMVGVGDGKGVILGCAGR